MIRIESLGEGALSFVVRQRSGLFEVMVPVLCNLVTWMCDGAEVIFF